MFFRGLLLLILLVSQVFGNSFENSDESEIVEQQNNHGHSGFHSRVNEDEEENGFSYKVDENVENSGEKSQNIKLPATPYGANRDDKQKTSTHERQVITGIPDLSDPCFRRYSNSIIVNAQPYERRSSISLVSCKAQCLKSQVGPYSCRSFVYDNSNQVCDLFGHVGDQSPARLLRFQTRDYFEPTAAISCNSDALLLSLPSTTTFAPALPAHAAATAVLKEQQTLTENFPTFENSVAHPSGLAPPPPPPPTFPSCETGKTVRFLKTKDFELDRYDDIVVVPSSLDECINLCSNNVATNGSSFKCNSFEFAESKCVLSSETAVPLGNGQLKQQSGSDYYEKVCIDEKIAGECSEIYNRFPQMILVGFAETVVDASSLQQCFDNCLNSRKLYGFKCISGMYYFEEPQLNCILNTEDRFTQPDLFTTESADLVDYFETGCNISQLGATRRFASSSATGHSNTFGIKKHDFVEKKQSDQFGWTNWSLCGEGSTVQQRTKICAQDKICGHEHRPCGEAGGAAEVTKTRQKPPTYSKKKILRALKKLECPLTVCCPIFNDCKIGMLQKESGELEWCTNPCPTQEPSRK
uniref:Apple domain-containing protein n=1 Tax=Panagrolaimus sp. ES5 TaxID=591445 RepID=A0AC34F1S0_9BILA